MIPVHAPFFLNADSVIGSDIVINVDAWYWYSIFRRRPRWRVTLAELADVKIPRCASDFLNSVCNFSVFCCACIISPHS